MNCVCKKRASVSDSLRPCPVKRKLLELSPDMLPTRPPLLLEQVLQTQARFIARFYQKCDLKEIGLFLAEVCYSKVVTNVRQ